MPLIRKRPPLHSFTTDQLEELIHRHMGAFDHATDCAAQCIPGEGRHGTVEMRPAMTWALVATMHWFHADNAILELNEREDLESMLDWEAP